MTSINNLPEEVLRMIFKQADDVDECQKVCRSWYSIAHILFLNEIDLYGNSRIEEFIRAIDHNPKKLYLNAVKEMDIYISTYEVDTRLEKTKIKKLFFRFPQLKKVGFTGSLTTIEDFDDELCGEWLTSCPKLETFTVDVNDGSQYTDYIYKLRLLVTSISIERTNDVSKFGGVLQFLTNFPRLKEINGSVSVDNIQAFLPVLTKLFQLTTIKLVCEKDDHDGFAENPETTDQLVKQLSTVKDLKLVFRGKFHLNSTIFVSKYMTGLDNLLLACVLQKGWTDSSQRLFCNYVLDLTTAINNSRLELTMNLETLADYFPIFAHKVFHQTVSNNEKMPQTTLQVNIKDKEDTPNLATLIVMTKRSVTQHISILVSKHTNLRDLSAKLFKTTTLYQNIDKFILQIPKRSQTSHYNQKATIDMYGGIVKRMPMLEELELDIPASYKDGKPTISFEDTHKKMNKLVLRASEDGKFESLLDNYSLMFPNLKHLGIYYFSGRWREYIGEFQVELGKYVLNSLKIDMTPVRSKTKTHLKKDYIGTEDFFVIEVTRISLGERSLYKIPFFHHLSNVTRIQDDDLKGLIRGKDYLGVRITIYNLDKLEICVKREKFTDEDEDDLPVFSYRMNSITVFDSTKKD